MTDIDEFITIVISKDLEGLIPEYIESMNKSLILLSKLIEDKNFSELKSEAHKMKGHGGAYGINYISDMGLLIEGFAREEKIELIKKCVRELKIYMSKLKIEFSENA
ncbi:MAG: hypothetical protein IPL26_28065 [Leptospiraceae bacterium]|nr:hypothetical protein [Leptospiraceae bacterium]